MQRRSRAVRNTRDWCVSFAIWPFLAPEDRKSTRLNSSHGYISYAVFCLKKKKIPTALDLQAGGVPIPASEVFSGGTVMLFVESRRGAAHLVVTFMDLSHALDRTRAITPQ